MPSKKQINAKEFLKHRNSKTIRALDINTKRLVTHAQDKDRISPSIIIEDLKLMSLYYTQCLLINLKRNDVIKIDETIIWKEKYQLPTFNIRFSLSKSRKIRKIILHSKESKIFFDASDVVAYYKSIDDRRFYEILNIGSLSEYLKFLQNKYFVYIFLEIINDYKSSTKNSHLFFKIHDKKARIEKYTHALETLNEISNLFNKNIIDTLDEVENIIINYTDISEKKYNNIIKESIMLKLKNHGLSNTASKNFYKDLKTFIS